MAKLTKRMVDAAKAEAKSFLLWDGELRGFGVLLHPTNAKTFILQYRNKARRSRRLTIGRYGALTVEEARVIAKEAAAAVARGEDSVADRRNYREAPTVAELLERYLKDHVALHNAASTEKDVKVIVEKISETSPRINQGQ